MRTIDRYNPIFLDVSARLQYRTSTLLLSTRILEAKYLQAALLIYGSFSMVTHKRTNNSTRFGRHPIRNRQLSTNVSILQSICVCFIFVKNI